MDELKKKFDGALQWPISYWISFLAKGAGPKKRFQYCLNPNSSKQFLYFTAIQGHSEHNLVDPELQDNVLLQGDFTEYIFHIGNKSDIHSIIRGGLIPGGRSLERERRSVFFIIGIRWTTIRVWRKLYATWTSQGSHLTEILGALITTQYIGATRSEERIAVLSNTITHNRSLQHAACDLSWKRGMREDEGGVIPQGIPISKTATCCTQSEFAKWTTRSIRTRRKNILWPPKRIAEFQGNLVQQRWLQNTRHTPFSSRTAGHESQRLSQKVDSAVREPPERGVFPAGLE